MNPDNFQNVWQSQSVPPSLVIDPNLLLKEVQRNQRSFTTMIFWRDVREIGIGLLMIPVWLYLGMKFSLPWTWYLTIPALMWIVGYLWSDQIRQKQRSPKPDDSLRQSVESSVAQVEHQIWLLRNVLRWYLLPIALSVLAFFCQVAWQGLLEVSDAGLTAMALMAVIFAGVFAIMGMILVGIYQINQYAIRVELEPRRKELESLLKSLSEDVPDPG